MVYGTRLESVTRKGPWVRIPPPPPRFKKFELQKVCMFTSNEVFGAPDALERFKGQVVLIRNGYTHRDIKFRIDRVLPPPKDYDGERVVVAQVIGTTWYKTPRGEESSDSVKLYVFQGFSIRSLDETPLLHETLRPLSDVEIKSMAVKLAQEVMRTQRGPNIGDKVCHPSDKAEYILDRVEGEIAFVSRPLVSGIVHNQFPVDELFSLATAKQIATDLMKENARKQQMN